MNPKELGEDVAFFLYLVPIIAGIVYFAYEWYATAQAYSNYLGLAYLIVTKSPYLFIVSIVAVCVAVIAEVRTSDPANRESIIHANTSRLLTLAIVVLIASFIGAYAQSGNDFGNAVTLFVDGRQVFLFAFLLILISIFLNPKEVYGNAKLGALPEVLGLIFLVASPALFYLGVRMIHSFAASAGMGLVAFVVGLVLLASSRLSRKKQSAATGTPATPKTA